MSAPQAPGAFASAAGAFALAGGEHPLQFGMPGGPEILIVLLMLLMLLLPVALVVLVVVGLLRLRGARSTDDRVAALERRVAELESELEAERTPDDGPSGDADRPEDRR